MLLCRSILLHVYMLRQTWCILIQVRDCSFNAAWRSDRLGHWDLVGRILEQKGVLNPIFAVPWVDSACFKIDWLHCCDLGVAADYMGNLFLMLARKLPTRPLSQQVQMLWEKMLLWYTQNKVQDRLPQLLASTLQQPGKAPKLRASAAQVRALVPFALECAQELLSADDPVEAAARTGMHHLNQCYMSLDSSSVFSSDVLRDSSVRFAQQYVALESWFPDPMAWRIKPKLHLFLELASEGSRPSMFWNYRDEDWGGSVARFARRRGGKYTLARFSANVLHRFRVQQPVVRMLPALQ